MIVGIMILLVAASWVSTFIFYNRLPQEIPVHFSMDKEIPGMGPKWMFLIFPGISTFMAILGFVFYRFRQVINFPGKDRLKDLPVELSGPVYNRAYQITIMNLNFVIMLMIYIQVNIALYTLGRLDKFNYEVMLIVIGVIAVYTIFSMFTLSKMSRLAAELHERWKEEKED